MIYSPITKYLAQDSYDRLREGFSKNPDKPMTPNEPLLHFMIQTLNVVSHVGPALMMTSAANPNVRSYYYQGPGKHAYRATTSNAYRLGATIGKHLAWPGSARILVGNSKKAVAARAAMAKGARIGGRIGSKAIPGIGWAMLAYDAYDLIANRRFFGVQL